MVVYATPPIDWWDGWTPLSQMVVHRPDFDDGNWLSKELLASAVTASRLFTRNTYWEGDGNWYVAPLPVMDSDVQEVMFVVAVKQSNNGSTFLASPIPLPWLEEYRCEKKAR